jgi:hypothetical protein
MRGGGAHPLHHDVQFHLQVCISSDVTEPQHVLRRYMKCFVGRPTANRFVEGTGLIPGSQLQHAHTAKRPSRIRIEKI